MREPLLMLGALLAALGVGFGAFGAHGLKARLGASLATWETAVFYQLIHALAIVAVAVLIRSGAELPGLRSIGWLFCVGILLFSGSLYVLALGGPRWFGPITPLGGVAFIAGWLWLAVAAARSGAGS
ncbi:MAG: DUF423 domain-containing protein [Gammaproteobacteria bacterium]|nr:DUF423 domain-containing protein [Gammaproteobacteria bacterium]